MLLRICIVCSICFAVAVVALPQSSSKSRHRVSKPAVKPQPKEEPTPPAAPEPSTEPTTQLTPAENQPEEQQSVESLKIDTDLVTVPVIASTRDGNYIPDLRQEEFSVAEDGQAQQIAFFATVSAPFHVVLLLDTSASTEEKLKSIQQAAVSFVEQLQSADRVKVISFDNELRELSEFTNDRTMLRNAIYKTVSGRGTRLYDAFELALASIRTIPGRKAIVLFSDGVDSYSVQATFDSSLHGLDEEGVVVYPIRFETRAETERIARGAMDDTTPQLPTRDVIHRAPPGTTPPTFPSDDPDTVPTSGNRKATGPFGLPTAGEIMRRQGRRDPDAERFPGDGLPPASEPKTPNPPTGQPDGRPNSRDPQPKPGDDRGRTFPSGRTNPQEGDSIDLMLDHLYLKADSYLIELANKSGGRILRADTVSSLPDAFAKIAAELRTQYAIGYYPANKARDGKYRQIKVTTTRKSVVVRARPGYRAPN